MRHSIAAIIPLYNGARWIKQALSSVLAQTLPPDEIIVVDDGSMDGGGKLIESEAARDRRIQLLRKENGGQSSARNAGAAASYSPLLAFLDQDDRWLPGHLEGLNGAFDCHPDLGFCFSDTDVVDETGKVIWQRFLRLRSLNKTKRLIADCAAADMFVLPSAALISRAAFERVGGFDERLVGYEDDDLFLRIIAAGYSNVFIDEPLSEWRFHTGRSTHTARMTVSRLIYFKKLLAGHPSLGPILGRRFAPAFIHDLIQCIRERDMVRLDAALEGIGLATNNLPIAKRAIVRAALAALRTSPSGVATLVKFSPVRITGRLLFRYFGIGAPAHPKPLLINRIVMGDLGRPE